MRFSVGLEQTNIAQWTQARCPSMRMSAGMRKEERKKRRDERRREMKQMRKWAKVSNSKGSGSLGACAENDWQSTLLRNDSNQLMVLGSGALVTPKIIKTVVKNLNPRTLGGR